MSKCSFCGEAMPIASGKMLVFKSGIVKNFCCSKCEKNFNLKRDPKNVKWVKKKRK